jgi:hypothetical protein
MILDRARDLFESIARFADRHSPQTLFARALIIIVVPMLLLQALSAWWFYSQRGDNVTNRLALLLVRDLRLVIALRADFPDDAPLFHPARPGTCCSMSASARASCGRSGAGISTSPPESGRSGRSQAPTIDNDVGGSQMLIGSTPTATSWTCWCRTCG